MYAWVISSDFFRRSVVLPLKIVHYCIYTPLVGTRLRMLREAAHKLNQSGIIANSCVDSCSCVRHIGCIYSNMGSTNNAKLISSLVVWPSFVHILRPTIYSTNVLVIPNAALPDVKGIHRKSHPGWGEKQPFLCIFLVFFTFRRKEYFCGFKRSFHFDYGPNTDRI